MLGFFPSFFTCLFLTFMVKCNCNSCILFRKLNKQDFFHTEGNDCVWKQTNKQHMTNGCLESIQMKLDTWNLLGENGDDIFISKIYYAFDALFTFTIENTPLIFMVKHSESGLFLQYKLIELKATAAANRMNGEKKKTTTDNFKQFQQQMELINKFYWWESAELCACIFIRFYNLDCLGESKWEWKRKNQPKWKCILDDEKTFNGLNLILGRIYAI